MSLDLAWRRIWQARTVARNEAQSVADLSSIVLSRTGEVVSTTDPGLPWHVDGLDQNQDVALIDDFLRELSANDCSDQTLRSYSFDLLRWWRFLAALGQRWDNATRTDVRIWCCGCAKRGPLAIGRQLSITRCLCSPCSTSIRAAWAQVR